MAASGLNQDVLLMLGLPVFILLFLYRWLLPKPIPGIPYNPGATRTILGDIPSMVKYTTETKELYQWIVNQNIKLQSPIIQLFARPFRKPWVIVADFQETRDVMLRRTQEFDRSPFWGEVSGGIFPQCHVHMPTASTFKEQRRWLHGLMTPAFLHDVAVTHMYTVCLSLIQLWGHKMRLAADHPFAAAEDVNLVALDAIWRIVFGEESSVSTTDNQLTLYESIGLNGVPRPAHRDAEITLPRAPCPPQIEAIITLEESGRPESPLPKVAHWFVRKTSSYRNAYNLKEKMIGEEIVKALSRAKRDARVKCGIDEMLRRESLIAEKEGRQPQPFSRGIQDEV